MASRVHPYLAALLENGPDLRPQANAGDELIDVPVCQHEECRTRHLVSLKVVDDFVVYVFVGKKASKLFHGERFNRRRRHGHFLAIYRRD